MADRAGRDTGCALGDPFEFYARVAQPDSVLLFLGGGGACWDAASCMAESSAPVRARTSARPYSNGIVDVRDDRNPFRNHSIVIVPYCTGDAHLGSRTVDYRRRGDDSSPVVTFHHIGARNARAALRWIDRQLPSATHFVVAGQSAGAITAPYYAALLARKHPSAHVVSIGNGAGALRAQRLTWFVLGRWGADSLLVADGLVDATTADRITFGDLYVGANRLAPGVRLAQVNSIADGTQAMILAALGLRDVAVSSLLADGTAELETAVPDFRFFVVPGDHHTFLSSPTIYDAESEGVRLIDWIADLAQGGQVGSVGRVLFEGSGGGPQRDR